MITLNFGSETPNVYTDMADRITRDLVALQIPPPKHEALVDAIVDTIDSDTLRYGFALAGIGKIDEPWHLVSWGEAAYSGNIDQYSQQALSSFEEALAYVIGEIDAAGITPTGITSPEADAICLSGEEGVLVTIRPVPCEPANPKARERYRKSFQMTSRRGHRAAQHRALMDIPGYAELDRNSDRNLKLLPKKILDLDLKDDEPEGGPLVHSPGSLSFAIGSLLQGFNIELRKARLLELTAHAFGSPSWNVWRSADERTPCCRLPCQMTVTDPLTKATSDRFYRCFWEALPEFISTCARINLETPLAPPSFETSMQAGMPMLSVPTLKERKKEIASRKVGGHHFAEDVAFLSPMDLAYGFDETPESVRRVMAHPQGVMAGLHELFQLEAPTNAKSMRALARRGFTLQTMRRWKNYLFLLSGAEEGRHSTHLFVEDDTQVGRKRSVGSAACYKGKIARVQENVWVLVSDYGRKVEAAFNGMTDEEAEAIGKFAGLEISRYAADDKRYLRSKLLKAGVEDHPRFRTFSPWSSAHWNERLRDLIQKTRKDLGPDKPLVIPGKCVIRSKESNRLEVEIDPGYAQGLKIFDADSDQRLWTLCSWLEAQT